MPAKSKTAKTKKPQLKVKDLKVSAKGIKNVKGGAIYMRGSGGGAG